MPSNYLVSRVHITGLWGHQEIALNPYPDVTFLIGRNGSGKTTVINLLAAALEGDLNALRRSSFNTITINLRNALTGEETVTVIVSRHLPTRSRQAHISYSITEAGKEKAAAEYPTDAPAYALDQPTEIRHRGRGPSLQFQLRELVSTAWISVHRSRFTPQRYDFEPTPTYESTVDKKLDELANSLVRYFSQLNVQAEQPLHQFHQEIFRALLARTSASGIEVPSDLEGLENSKAALLELIHTLEFWDPSPVIDDVVWHYDVVKEVATKLPRDRDARTQAGGIPDRPDKPEFDTAKFERFLLNWRVERVVSEWNRVQQRRQEILAPRDTFLKVINRLLWRKELALNEKNELFGTSFKRDTLSLKDLSSGEKQLVILFGEALLRAKTPCVYIADEPELSLHVSWQEQVVQTLRELSPGAQIIVATHSPDIVSNMQDKVVDMERLID
jgi:predicted ATPase